MTTKVLLFAAITAIATWGCAGVGPRPINDSDGDNANGDGLGGAGDVGGGDTDGTDNGADTTNGNGTTDGDGDGGGDVVDPGSGDDPTDGDTPDDSGGDGTGSQGVDVEVMDFSGFQQFSFSRTPALGFCPPLDAVYSASIFVNFDDSFELSMSILREGIIGQDVCVGHLVVPCAAATEMRARTLTAIEAASVVTAFSHVQVDNAVDPVCDQVAIDSCVINLFSWGSFSATDYECSSPRLLPEQAQTLINLLEGLRN
jgi:hypothetical protein